MRAMVLREHGGLDKLTFDPNFPDPDIGPADVLLRVRATSLNYHDIFTRRGMPGIKIPLPVIMGLDVAGEIVKVGSDVKEWKPGDRVLVDPLNRVEGGLMGETMNGGLAELCKARAHQLVRIPDNVSFEQAAALPVAYGTAHRMMAMLARERDLLETLDFSSVTSVMMGSAPLTKSLVEKVQSLFPGAATSNAYGTTEAGPGVFGPHPDGLPRPDTALGYPTAGAQAELREGPSPDQGVLYMNASALPVAAEQM